MIELAWIYWDPKPELFTLPGVNWPILWYGIFFALGFALGFPLFVSILLRYFLNRPGYAGSDIASLKKKALHLTDQLTIYIVLGTVIGARLGHFLFYENPSDYFSNPMQIFYVWNGGLASHGGVIGIILAVMLFSYRIRKSGDDLTWIRILDFLSVPAALGASFIRLGNFFNQEILGTPTNLPWAIVFGHPADRSLPIPRHPVQLYECLFYLAVFFLLWMLSYRNSFLLARGKMVGILLILVFGFRFCIEFIKTEQSHLLSLSSSLTMGQYLSIPLILAGIFFYFWKK